MEIELRARITDSVAIEKRIESLHGVFVKETTQKDEYFKAGEDTPGVAILRIRTTQRGSEFAIKGVSKIDGVGAFDEWEAPLKDPDVLRSVLLNNGYRNLFTIDKLRRSYRIDDIEINIDAVKELGDFIEVEIISDDVDSSKERLITMLSQLGVSESDCIAEGYPQLYRKL